MTEDDSASPHNESAGFLNSEEVLGWGVNKVGPMEKNELSAYDEYDRLDTMDPEDRLRRIEELGASLTQPYYNRFVDALVSSLLGGTLDVTGWTRLAIKAVLIVCSERDLSVTLKNKSKAISPVSYPKEGPLLDMFVESIFSGKWA